MSILEHLYDKYGTELIDSIFEKINHGDRNFAAFYQYISVSEHYNVNNFSYYKAHIVPEFEKIIKNKYLQYELTNILGEFNFENKTYNTGISYGTFDMFHVGHLNLLKQAKMLCNTLIVGVSTDSFNEQKGKHCIIPFDDRCKIVNGCRYTDKVIAEENWEQKVNDIIQYKVDCFMIGDDWKGQFDFLTKHCDVLYLSRTHGISTTQIKNDVKNSVINDKSD